MPFLELDDITLRLGGETLVEGLRLSVPCGGAATIMGPSGAGKSSLLAYVSGALEPGFTATGRVLLDGEALDGLPPERRRLGILFQDDLLFPHMTVAENLLFAVPGGLPRSERRERAETALEEAGLAGFGPRDPATLSGGQRARVALMRTLVSGPRALLLDEPFSALDSALRRDFRHFVFSHARELGLPTLLVTHDPEDAAQAGGPVLTIMPGGRVEHGAVATEAPV